MDTMMIDSLHHYSVRLRLTGGIFQKREKLPQIAQVISQGVSGNVFLDTKKGAVAID
jgi:hypothetical protein